MDDTSQDLKPADHGEGAGQFEGAARAREPGEEAATDPGTLYDTSQDLNTADHDEGAGHFRGAAVVRDPGVEAVIARDPKVPVALGWNVAQYYAWQAAVRLRCLSRTTIIRERRRSLKKSKHSDLRKESP